MFLLGRFLYGLVGESMLIGLDVLVSDWFRHAELGLAMGVVQGAAQTGSVAAFYGVPPLIAALSVTTLSAMSSVGAGLGATLVPPAPM